jgi:hypothetical protein
MEMMKAVWSNKDEDKFSLSMSISKVDKARRLVYGWGTVDNPDLQDDVVTAEASQKAFAKFRGNVREMHQPIAAGRMVSYKPQQYYDEDSGEVYDGIFVSTYVSEGAEDTWKKVLDGTLSAFSINGVVNESFQKYDEKTGKMLRYVTDYTMRELSLVDAGGNQFSNVVSIVKSVDGEGEHLEGDLSKVEIANVFMCKDDNIIELSSDESLVCQFGHDMKNIGWVENNTPQTMEKVRGLVKEAASISKSDEGGVDEMAEEVVTTEEGTEETVVKSEEVPHEEAVAEEESAVVDEAAEEVVKSEESEETTEEVGGDAVDVDAADALEKAIDKAIEELRKSDERRDERVEQIMKDIDGKMDEFREEFSKKFASYEEKQADITKALEAVEANVNGMSKSVTGLQDASAEKKSGDLGGEPEGDLSKSEEKKPGIWRGAIL